MAESPPSRTRAASALPARFTPASPCMMSQTSSGGSRMSFRLRRKMFVIRCTALSLGEPASLVRARHRHYGREAGGLGHWSSKKDSPEIEIHLALRHEDV